MDLLPDYKEFLKLLQEHKVQYLIVGGYSVAFHGYPRFTGDIDIWVHPTKENALNIVRALKEFGFMQFKWQDFSESSKVIQLGYEPVRIDIMTTIDGIPSFEKASSNAEYLNLEDLNIPFIGYHDLIKNKKSTGRLQDLNDIQQLTKRKDSNAGD